jgi:inhibitor of cysteine peptidase
MTSIDESFDGKTVALAPGEDLELRLAENPTTGARWRMSADGAPAIEHKGDSFTPGGTQPGKGGVHAWRFRAAQPGRGRIELAHGRSWDPGAAPGRTFSVTVEVRKAG